MDLEKKNKLVAECCTSCIFRDLGACDCCAVMREIVEHNEAQKRGWRMSKIYYVIRIITKDLYPTHSLHFSYLRKMHKNSAIYCAWIDHALQFKSAEAAATFIAENNLSNDNHAASVILLSDGKGGEND